MGWTCDLGKLADITGGATNAPKTVFTGVSTDTRRLAPGNLFVALSGEHYDGHSFVGQAVDSGAAAVLVEHPVEAGPAVVVPDSLAALQAFAAWRRRQVSIPVLAITGSCGKTSSKDLCAAVLGERRRVVKTHGNLNNHIGCPLSVLTMDETTEAAVIEMGANHMGEIAALCEIARPTESAITMIGPSHLEGFGSIENIAKAKSEIVQALPPDGLFYVNANDPYCVEIADAFKGRKVYFGANGQVTLQNWTHSAEGMTLDIDPIGRVKLPLHTPALLSNVLLAVAVGLEHGVTVFEGPLQDACRNTTRLRIEQIGPLEVIDDTYNANPASMAAALETLRLRATPGRALAALGEMLELGAATGDLHEQLGRQAAQAGVQALFVRGPHACDMIRGAQAAHVPHAEVMQDHAAIARALYACAQPGDVLLVKGSRGMRMERVVESLRELYARKETP